MGYDRKYYKRHLDQYHEWEQALALDYFVHYAPNSVLDLGCGIGSYLLGFKKCGLEEVKGIEYNYEIAKEFMDKDIIDHIVQGDVTEDDVMHPYRWIQCIWCIEVAEHIKPESTDSFLDVLTSHALQKIVLSAAPPGQKGTGHINCRPRNFWINELDKRDFIYLKDESRLMALRWEILGAPEYIVDNIMLFKRNIHVN